MIPDDTHLLIGSLKRRAGRQLVSEFLSPDEHWRKARGFWQFCQGNRLYIVLHVEQSVLSARSPKSQQKVAARRSLNTPTKG